MSKRMARGMARSMAQPMTQPMDEAERGSGAGAPGFIATSRVVYFPMNEGAGRFVANSDAVSQVNPQSTAFAREQNFGTSGGKIWEPANMTITENYAVFPVTGQNILTRLQSTNNAAHYIFQDGVNTTPGPYVFSFWGKSNTGLDQVTTFAYLDSGGFLTPVATVTVTVAGGYIEVPYTAAGSANTMLFPFNSTGTAIDISVTQVRVDPGVARVTAPESEFHGELPYPGEDPAWSAAGLTWESSGDDYVIATGEAVFSDISVYAVVKRTGTLSNALYAPIAGTPASGFTIDGFLLVGKYANSIPTFSFGPLSKFVEAYIASIEDGAEHSVAGVYTSSSGLLQIFIDGCLVGEKNVGAISPVTIYRIFLGTMNFAAYWAGPYHTFALYNAAHSITEVRQQHAALIPLMADKGVTLPTVTNQVIFDGDSNMSSTYAIDPVENWAFLALNEISPRPQGMNYAVAGYTLAELTTNFNTAKLSMLPNTNIVLLIQEGHNDCWSPTNEADLTALITLYRNWAISIGSTLMPILCTVPTSGYSDVPHGAYAPHIATLNTSRRANYLAIGAFALLDIAAIPELADYNNATYFSDTVHLTPAAHVLVAALAVSVLESQMVGV